MKATSATVFVIFLKLPFQKFGDHNRVKVSSQQLLGTLTTSF